MSEVVFKEGVLLSELTEADVPWGGDVPDVGRVLPMGHEVATFFPRLVFGAMDDADRAKVPAWRQVDDLGGLVPLWAGEAAGKVFLHAGESAPAAGSPDDEELQCSPVAAVGLDGSVQGWNAGVPQLPYHVVPMAARERVLKNATGEWRRLDWEPLGSFDVFVNKEVLGEDGYDFVRYTLWCVVVGSFVVLYTTKATWGSKLMSAGAEARWPYCRWLRKARVNLGYDLNTTVYGAHWSEFLGGEQDVEMPGGCFVRLAPLPWQFDEADRLEAKGADEAAGGLAEGQFYALPPVSVVPRYLAPHNEFHVFQMLTDAYLTAGEAGGNPGFYGKITKEEAHAATVELVQRWASEHYCVDPLLHEEIGRVFPDAAQEGSLTWTRPNEFRLVFELHLDAGAVTHWPHWMGLMVAAAPSGLQMAASVCAVYNWGTFIEDDYTGGGGGGGGGGNNFEEEEDEEEEDDDDSGGGDGGDGEDDNEDDNEDDDEEETGPDEKIAVQIGYEAGEGFSSCTLVRKAGAYYWKLVLNPSYVQSAVKGLEVPGKMTLAANGSSQGNIATVRMSLGESSGSASGTDASGSGALLFKGTQGSAGVASRTHNFNYNVNLSLEVPGKTWYLSPQKMSSAGSWVKLARSSGASNFNVRAQVWYKWVVDREALRRAGVNQMKTELGKRTLSDSDSSTSHDSTVTGTLSGTALAIRAEATLS